MTIEDVAGRGGPIRNASAAPAGPGNRRTAVGVALMIASPLSCQTGAALGALAFPVIGPAGVVAVRQTVAAVVLGVVARPSIRGLRWAQWWPMIALGVSLATMNLAVYFAVQRIGLGLAVALEFVGPLLVALFALRRVRDGALALLSGVGVYLLVLPGRSTDYLGLGLALLAALCWASYILLSRTVGQRFSGVEGSALAIVIAALLYAPVTVALATSGTLWTGAVAYAVAAGVLSSAIPYAADVMALRRIPAGLFAVFTSLHPVCAALAGMVILGQFLALHEWLGIACIAFANVAVVAARRATARQSSRQTEGQTPRYEFGVPS